MTMQKQAKEIVININAFTHAMPGIGACIRMTMYMLSMGKFIVISSIFPGSPSSCQCTMQKIEKEFMKHALKALENSTNVVKEDGIVL